MREGLAIIDRELGDRPFLCGDNPTLADIDLLVAIEVLNWVKESLSEDCVRLQAWLERTRSAFGA